MFFFPFVLRSPAQSAGLRVVVVVVVVVLKAGSRLRYQAYRHIGRSVFHDHRSDTAPELTTWAHLHVYEREGVNGLLACAVIIIIIITIIIIIFQDCVKPTVFRAPTSFSPKSEPNRVLTSSDFNVMNSNPSAL